MDNFTELKQESSNQDLKPPSQLFLKKDPFDNSWPNSQLPEEKEDIGCPWILMKGGREGEPCGRYVAEGETYCSAHIQSILNKQPSKVSKSEDLPELESLISQPPSSKPNQELVQPSTTEEHLLLIMTNLSVFLANFSQTLRQK